MNKEFVKKMIKAKRLEYEAIKEIIPDNIKNRVECFEKDAFNLIKDIAIEIAKEDIKDRNSEGKYDMDSKSNKDNKSIKKIDVNF